LICRRVDIYRPEETGALVFNLKETGTIVSVFDKAINVRVSDRRLVSIVRHAEAMAPMSVLCPKLLDSGEILRTGQRIILSEGLLVADDWHLDTHGSDRFEGHPTIVKPFCMDAQKLDLFEKILHFSGQKDGLLGVTRDGEPRNNFVRKGREIVEKIIGLGPGFTPAGDDLIGGFLMGEALARNEHRLFLDAMPVTQGLVSDRKFRTILWNAAAETCDAGRTLIWMALRGHFPRFLCRAAAELSRAETSKDMLAVVTRATRYGHTSGTDALTGLLLYFKTCLRHLHHDRRRINKPTDVRPKHNAFSG